jgi:hypothetical protein
LTRVDAEPGLATPSLDGAIQKIRVNMLTPDTLAPGQKDLSLQTTHRNLNILSAPYLRGVQEAVDLQTGTLLSRELGLKSGGSATGPTTQK